MGFVDFGVWLGDLVLCGLLWYSLSGFVGVVRWVRRVVRALVWLVVFGGFWWFVSLRVFGFSCDFQPSVGLV